MNLIQSFKRSSNVHLFCLTVVICSCLGCGNGLGQKIIANGTEVYYDGEQVTKADAERLGKALTELEFSDGAAKSVQLQRNGEKLIFKMVMLKEHLESNKLDPDLKLMSLQLSAFFDGKAVEVHKCDDQMVSKMHVQGLVGKTSEFHGGQIYYNGLDADQLAQLKKVLNTMGFEGFEGALYFGKSKDGYEFRMICTPEDCKDEAVVSESKELRKLFTEIVGGAKVNVKFCDECFESHQTLE